MKRLSLALALLLALASTAVAAAQPKDDERIAPPPATLPPTAVDRADNNPAKAAVAAREAQKKEQNAAAQISPPAAAADPNQPAPTVPTPLMQSISTALRKDPRTVDLEIDVRADGSGVGLHGTVPSEQARVIAESVAAQAAAPTRIQNHLIVTTR